MGREFYSIIVLPLVLLFLIPLQSYGQGNVISIFSINEEDAPRIDGVWTRNDEWNTASERIIDYTNGAQVVIRTAHDRTNIYILVEHVTDITLGGGDFRVCLDTENDGGMPKLDDYCLLLSRKDYALGRGDGDSFKYHEAPEGFTAAEGVSGELSPYYDGNEHISAEFQFPLDFIGRNSEYGFFVFIPDANAGKYYTFPAGLDSYPDPARWALLQSPDVTEPQSNIENHYSGGGLELRLPDGWESSESTDPLNPSIKVLTASPAGSDVSMSISWTSKSIAKAILPYVQSQGIYGCLTLSYSFVNVNGMIASESTEECSREIYSEYSQKSREYDEVTAFNLPEYSKTKSYLIADDDTLVGVAFRAASPEAFEDYLPEFDSSVATLQMTGAFDVREQIQNDLELNVVNYDVKAERNSVSVELASGLGAKVSNFNFDEASKQISFRVDSSEDFGGLVLLSVGKVLKGPYTVMVDGEQGNYLTISDDVDEPYQRMLLGKNDKSYDIVITGTQVVPEFPIHVVGILAALTGLVIIVTRRELVPGL